ncbi:3-deoxy-manno-octulosonate cytidylyltransferase [Rhizobium mongolense]|uniref:3-deoxy-manno-octulosonate cytidylyltransferase n=1 Tax=Rhizobium gallicum TaxID=56730 RepID=A0A1L5ND21_9HYPH|nr:MULTISPECIES: 3-deoxy-manno-octulosonate cytidylyltransferase [Rhizobium]APO65797.1 3-deoxy-manno-octulosonate cytidylyltransferase [Rhizobium gallicum]QPB19746.1 3-deoxy-manno-octulosonate cytidylyltransferase [Rhizobium sp. 007]WFU87300.1 3-deoxy-manno-octulosonate cytidylyltransferase [Rhizobium sp. CC1099]
MTASNLDDVLVLIPARMASTRLPGKPLADICGLPMIVQVALRAKEAEIGRVVIAVDDEEVFEAVSKAGFEVVMTRKDHQSGSDRIFEALHKVDPDASARIVVNVQGDLPTIDPETIRAALRPLEEETVDIATLTVEITDEEERTNPNVVKVVGSPLSETRLHALYFTRATAPYGQGPLYHHIGLYAYRRAALEKFVSLGPSALEKRESLEQLRALEAGMRIDVEIVKTVPLGVDTPADLDKARRILSARKA